MIRSNHLARVTAVSSRKTRALLLLMLPGMASCASAAFPHIGTVDTRLHPAGTVHAQASAGAGVSWFVPNFGATVAADTFLTRRLSLTTSAHVLSSIEEQVMPGGRLGLRFRLHRRFSLGAGASANTGLALLKDRNLKRRFATGIDLELATSRPLSGKRFASHAWRFELSSVPGLEESASFVGDWSRSRPTSNPRLRFSYGINYGVTVWSVGSRPAPPRDSEEMAPGSQLVAHTTGPQEGPIPFLGFHLGLQFGSPRIMTKE